MDESDATRATIDDRVAFDQMVPASGTEAAIQDDVAAVNNDKKLEETAKQLLVGLGGVEVASFPPAKEAVTRPWF